jgi:hypothetical protein
MAEPTTNPSDPRLRHRLARFVCDGITVNLQFEAAVKRTAGLKADVWRAMTTYREYDKLGGDIDRTGELQFLGDPDEAANPDVVIKQVVLTDAEPTEAGTVLGEDTSRAVVFRLFFTDSRQQFASPRGGRVKLGFINPSRQTDEGEGGGTVTMTSRELIAACLAAMGVSGVAIPPAADSVDAPKDLKWLGNPAVPELAKLLAQCGCLFLPKLDGAFAIVAEGEGQAPQFAETIIDVPVQGADRRARTVVVASYPTRAVTTIASGDLPSSAWEWVYEDDKGKWQPLPADAQTQVRSKAAGADGFYRHLRIGNNLFDPRNQAILAKVIARDGSQTTLFALAKVAVASNGVYSNSEELVQVPIVQIVADQNILSFGRRLGRVESPTVDPDSQFKPIDLSSEFDITMSVEQVEAVGDQLQPRFFEAGFTRSASSASEITLLDEDGTRNALADPKTFVVTAPDLQLIEDAEAEDNYDALQAKAAKLAAAYFAASAEPVRIIKTPGYATVELDGVVSEHEIDQMGYVSTVRCNTWHRPLSVYGSSDYRRASERGSSGVPHESRTAASRAALGSSGAGMPIVPVSLPPLPVSGVAGAFPARILGPANAEGGPAPYLWEEVDIDPAGGGTATVKTNGRKTYGDAPADPAVEINGDMGVPANEIVFMHEMSIPPLAAGQGDGTEATRLYAFDHSAGGPFLAKITAYTIGTGAGYEWEEWQPDGLAVKESGRTSTSTGSARAIEINGRTDVGPEEMAWMWPGLQWPAPTDPPAANPGTPTRTYRFAAGRRESVMIELRVANTGKSNWYDALVLKWSDAAQNVVVDDPTVLAINVAESVLSSGTDPAGHVVPLNTRVEAVVLSRKSPITGENYGRMIVAFRYQAGLTKAKILNNYSGGGKYRLALSSGSPVLTAATSTNLAVADYGTFPATQNAIGQNSVEAGTSLHGLANNSVVNVIVGPPHATLGFPVCEIVGTTSLPLAQGKGKVLKLMDGTYPGTWGVDYPEFHS